MRYFILEFRSIALWGHADKASKTFNAMKDRIVTNTKPARPDKHDVDCLLIGR